MFVVNMRKFIINEKNSFISYEIHIGGAIFKSRKQQQNNRYKLNIEKQLMEIRGMIY